MIPSGPTFASPHFQLSSVTITPSRNGAFALGFSWYSVFLHKKRAVNHIPMATIKLTGTRNRVVINLSSDILLIITCGDSSSAYGHKFISLWFSHTGIGFRASQSSRELQLSSTLPSSFAPDTQ